MKRIILLLLAVLLLGTFCMAQAVKEDLDIIQGVFQKDKRTLISDNINLSELQGKAFWLVYDDYESKRATLSRTRAEIMLDYLKAYDTLTDDAAAELVKRTISNDQAFSKLQKSYFSKFSKAVGGKNAAKFYQLENYIQQTVRSNVQNNIPFIDELQK